MLFLLVVGDFFKIYDLCPDILCDLLDLELPEVGQFDLDLPSRNCDDAEHGLMDSFPHLHSFPYINFHHVLFPQHVSTGIQLNPSLSIDISVDYRTDY
jgi:hypothetical protein